jgi:hypothetical protein
MICLPSDKESAKAAAASGITLQILLDRRERKQFELNAKSTLLVAEMKNYSEHTDLGLFRSLFNPFQGFLPIIIHSNNSGRVFTKD